MTESTPEFPARTALHHLRPGQVYDVAQRFQDAHGIEHGVGERWTFIGHEVVHGEASPSLRVVGSGLERTTIPLTASVTRALAEHLKRVEFLPNDAELPCACEEESIRQAEAGTLFAMVCRKCDIGRLLARADEGATMLLLDEESDTAMREALRLKDEGTWVEAAELAVNQPAGPAAALAWGALVVRPSLVEELRRPLDGHRSPN